MTAMYHLNARIIRLVTVGLFLAATLYAAWSTLAIPLLILLVLTAWTSCRR